MNVLSLDGKTAVVTGGAQGIGAATARMLERAGARVVVFDLRPDDGFSVDVTNEAAVKDAFARAADTLGGIDVLVNNAGRVARKPAVELPLAEWQAVLDVNLTARSFAHAPRILYEGARRWSDRQRRVHHGPVGGLFSNASYQASKGAW